MAGTDKAGSGRTQLIEWAQLNCLSILVLWGICGILILFSGPDRPAWVRIGFGILGLSVITVAMYFFREPWRSHDKRLHARVKVMSTNVRLTGESWADAKVSARDLSSGGLGLTVTGMEPSVCEKLALSHAVAATEIDLPGEKVLSLSTIVVWSQPGRGGTPARFGLKFVDVDEDSREKIHGLVRWLAQGTGEPQAYRPDDGV